MVKSNHIQFSTSRGGKIRIHKRNVLPNTKTAVPFWSEKVPKLLQKTATAHEKGFLKNTRDVLDESRASCVGWKLIFWWGDSFPQLPSHHSLYHTTMIDDTKRISPHVRDYFSSNRPSVQILHKIMRGVVWWRVSSQHRTRPNRVGPTIKKKAPRRVVSGVVSCLRKRWCQVVSKCTSKISFFHLFLFSPNWCFHVQLMYLFRLLQRWILQLVQEPNPVVVGRSSAVAKWLRAWRAGRLRERQGFRKRCVRLRDRLIQWYRRRSFSGGNLHVDAAWQSYPCSVIRRHMDARGKRWRAFASSSWDKVSRVLLLFGCALKWSMLWPIGLFGSCVDFMFLGRELMVNQLMVSGNLATRFKPLQFRLFY